MKTRKAAMMKASTSTPESSYTHWNNSRARLAQSADWYEVTDFMKALQEVKRECLANTVEAIEEAYEIIFVGVRKNKKNNVEPTYLAPYSKDKRFPANKMYVCDLFGDWKQKLKQMRLLCMEIIRKDKVEPNDTRFSKYLQELIDDCARGAYLLDRNEFEEWGYVLWTTKAS